MKAHLAGPLMGYWRGAAESWSLVHYAEATQVSRTLTSLML